MTEGNLARDSAEPAEPLFAGLAGSLEGDPDHRPPLILLHGLTFDRTMWLPAVAELRKLDPRRRVLAVTVWPASGHFPHLPQPGRFAECLAATAQRSTLPRRPAHIGRYTPLPARRPARTRRGPRRDAGPARIEEGIDQRGIGW